MADDVFRPQRKKITDVDLTPSEVRAMAAKGRSDREGGGDNPLDQVQKVQEAVAKETGRDIPKPFDVDQAPFDISGNIPQDFRKVMQDRANNPQQLQAGDVGQPENPDDKFEAFEAPPEKSRRKRTKKAVGDKKIKVAGSDALEGLLGRLAEEHQWEEFKWPSKAKFYDDIPEIVNVRAMTGEEEQILATPRWVKKGKAIDMIFKRCIKENIDTESLLSVDRTYLLIFLRGISYTPEYDVEIKCPDCGIKFSSVIDLNDLDVNACPDDFDTDELAGNLPTSGFSYSFRLATGADEQEITTYRERRIAAWGDQSEDDTLLYRTALLLEDIEGVTMKKELALLLKRLPINDVAHLRNEINEPPFGVDTDVPMVCPSCTEEFKIDLPLETNFFFPRKKEKMPA